MFNFVCMKTFTLINKIVGIFQLRKCKLHDKIRNHYTNYSFKMQY